MIDGTVVFRRHILGQPHTVYGFTSCGTLRKSSVSQLLPGLLSPGSSVVFSSSPPLPSAFYDGTSWLQGLPHLRSTEKNPSESPVEGCGRPWGKDEELDVVLLTGLLKLPIEFTPSIYLNSPHRKGALPEEFLEEYPGKILVA